MPAGDPEDRRHRQALVDREAARERLEPGGHDVRIRQGTRRGHLERDVLAGLELAVHDDRRRVLRVDGHGTRPDHHLRAGLRALARRGARGGAARRRSARDRRWPPGARRPAGRRAARPPATAAWSRRVVAADEVVEVDAPHRDAAAPGHREHLAGDVGELLADRSDGVEVVADRRVRRQLAQGEVRVADDHRELVVDVVRDPAREARHGVDPGRLLDPAVRAAGRGVRLGGRAGQPGVVVRVGRGHHRCRSAHAADGSAPGDRREPADRRRADGAFGYPGGGGAAGIRCRTGSRGTVPPGTASDPAAPGPPGSRRSRART